MVSAADICVPRFHDVLGDVTARRHTRYWLHGGRGSTKSSFISLILVLPVVAFPYADACVVRRFSNTLRDLVYQHVLWAVEALGLSPYFKAKLSPMEIVYLPTGQRVVFRGADDPLKLKGVKFTKGYCAVVWFEELNQFDGIEAVRSILNSLRRGDDDFWIFYSYNPPKTMWSWVNVECIERRRRADTLVRRSSYLDVVEARPGWLGVRQHRRGTVERCPRARVRARVQRRGLGMVLRPVALRAVRLGARRAQTERLRGTFRKQDHACRHGRASWWIPSPMPTRRVRSPTSTTRWCGATILPNPRCRWRRGGASWASGRTRRARSGCAGSPMAGWWGCGRSSSIPRGALAPSRSSPARSSCATATAAGGGWPLVILLAPISEQVFARILRPSRRA